MSSRHQSALGLIHLRSRKQLVCVSLLLARKRHCYAGWATHWTLPHISSLVKICMSYASVINQWKAPARPVQLLKLLVKRLRFVFKTAEQIELSFGVVSGVGPRNLLNRCARWYHLANTVEWLCVASVSGLPPGVAMA